ncbi:EutN/CcmL family microcompartment protein [Melioribacter sp. OK-6-Me]|uniref:EutN/CcmL family microcompartment protein n=1 Tax=unclassified Melioribacter TaxID=2627329 RepID=UPI003EDAFB88
MKFGLVIGNVVSTRKAGRMKGLKILVVNYLNENLEQTAHTAACIDTVNAGQGDIVLLCSSSSARLTAQTKEVATDNTIIGIVDSVSHGNKIIYKKQKS